MRFVVLGNCGVQGYFLDILRVNQLLFMFDQIDTSVAKYVQLTAAEQEMFHSLLKHKKVKKKHFLLQEGEVCTFETFIIKGCIRLYFIDKEGGGDHSLLRCRELVGE